MHVVFVFFNLGTRNTNDKFDKKKLIFYMYILYIYVLHGLNHVMFVILADQFLLIVS